MTPSELFKKKRVSLSEAVSLVQSDHTIAVALAGSEPPGLLEELGNHKDRLENIKVWVGLPLRKYAFVLNPTMAGHFFVENWFYGAPDREVHPQGRISYIPNNLHAAAKVRLDAAGGKLDIFWGTATPPDKRGFMSLSLGIVYEKYLIERADMVVLEINENLPWTLGDTQVHISDVDFVVENYQQLFELPTSEPTDWEKAIGGYIAELIDDGSTLQLGIGGIPNAITAYLTERRDLGVHTEMFNDGMVDLYEAGAITGNLKTLWKGKMVGAFALGTKKLYNFIDNNLGVEFQQGKVTNDPHIIGQNYKMISVNTALQVDLYGQVCSQSMGHRHFSGTGGQLDTHRGAQLSPGGRGIIALHSAVKGNTISTIVPRLTEGAQVTVASQDIDTVATEFGIAELKGRTVKQRAEALIKIAHPSFRDLLHEEVEKLGIVPRLIVPGVEFQQTKLKVTAPGVSQKEIKLGTFCDLTGPNASIGMAALRGYSAYYDHINRWGSIQGRKITLIVEDDGFDPKRTEGAVEKLINQDNVFAIVSPLGTITNLAVKNRLLQAKIPVVSPHSGLSIWGTPLKRTYFALQPSYEVEGRIMAQYTIEELKPERIAIFHVNDQFGIEGTSAFQKELSQTGLSPISVVSHDAGEGSPDRWVEEISKHSPDLVMLYTYLKPAADLLLESQRKNFHPEWLGSYVLSGPDLFRFTGKEASHGLRATSYASGPRYNRAEGLYSSLMARNYSDEKPGTHSRIGYAAAQLVVEGLKRTGPDLTREGFIKALESIKDWSGGLLPPISYSNTDHRGLTALSMMRALHGRWLVEKGVLQLKE